MDQSPHVIPVCAFGMDFAQLSPWCNRSVCSQANMEAARKLFRDPEMTEFIIVTIPTVMAARESARLATSLRREGVAVKNLLINQVLCCPAAVCRLHITTPFTPRRHAVIRKPSPGRIAQGLSGQRVLLLSRLVSCRSSLRVQQRSFYRLAAQTRSVLWPSYVRTRVCRNCKLCRHLSSTWRCEVWRP